MFIVKNDFNITKNFKLSELDSPDTNEIIIDMQAINKLQKLRDEVGKIKVLSGYRTRDYNNNINGFKNSYHLIGKAFDIKPLESEIVDVWEKAKKMFKSSICHDTYIHIADAGTQHIDARKKNK